MANENYSATMTGLLTAPPTSGQPGEMYGPNLIPGVPVKSDTPTTGAQQKTDTTQSGMPIIPTKTSTPTTGTMSDQGFMSVLTDMNARLQQNNALVDQKNLIQKHMFDAPLTSDELNKLPPDVRAVVQSGDQNAMKLQLQVINDSLQGRNQTVATAIQGLTTGWQAAQQAYNDHIKTVLDYSKALGQKPSDILRALYPAEAERLGKQLDTLSAPLLTTTQQAREQANITGGTDPISGLMDAIGQTESKGDYSAMGEPNSEGQRAYGKYQIMDFNIPIWTQEAIGRSLTPEEFLNDPAAQDATAKYMISNYYSQYGNPEDVASVWFTGLPASQSAGRKDVTGTTSEQYVQSVMGNYGKTTQADKTALGGDIYSATGLGYLEFQVLSGDQNALARQPASTRNRVNQNIEKYAKQAGLDTTTFKAQYKGLSEALQKNVERKNLVQTMEQELLGTVDNLVTASDEAALRNVKPVNIAKLYAGEQVNDPIVMKYTMPLIQMKSELAGYFAALEGKSSADKVHNDAAELVIKNGINSGVATAFKDAVEKSASKMGPVLDKRIDATRKDVWTLLGVGSKYKSTAKQDTGAKTAQDFSKMTDEELKAFIAANQ